jgi:hypothetical protein
MNERQTSENQATIDYDKPFCYECVFFYIMSEEPDQSEVTSGIGPEIVCARNHFLIDLGRGGDDITRQQFYDTIRKARDCKHFVKDKTLV